MDKEIEIVWVGIDTITQNPNNPKDITEEELQELMASIKGFPKMMEYRPPVVDKATGTIIGGNSRHKACLRLGWTKIPVIYMEDLTQDELREMVLRDNMQYGEWDFTKLREFYGQKELLSWGLDDAKFVSFFEPEDLPAPGEKAERAEPVYNEYEDHVIKKFIFNLTIEEYDQTMDKLEKYNTANQLEDNSEALLKLIETHKHARV